MQNRSPQSRKHRWSEVAARLPAHAVAAGSPVEPGGMEPWKVDCRSKRSLCIFTALRRKRRTGLDDGKTAALTPEPPGAGPVPVGAAGCGEEVDGWCCADGAPAGGDGRRVCGGEGGPLGELLEPLLLRRETQTRSSHRARRSLTAEAGAQGTFRALSRACSSSKAACFSRSSTFVKDIPVLASDDTAFDKVLAL